MRGLLLLAALLWILPLRAQTNFLTLLSSGPTANRLNIVFFSEGYTSSELDRFPNDARAMLDQLLITPPFNEYSNYFNAFAVSVPSNESGADHPSRGISRDTFFEATYDTSGINRLVTLGSIGYSRVANLLAKYMPEYDVAAVVVNDQEYGGSGGHPLTASVHRLSTEVMVHELGHNFGGLGDEYAASGGTPSEKPNTTRETDRDYIRWSSWILPSTPLPTPDIGYEDVVGLFRGAAYSLDFFRPKFNCKMRTLGVPFCEVCSEALVKSIYTKLTPIEGASFPTAKPIRVQPGGSLNFFVNHLEPISHLLTASWTLNGISIPNASTSSILLNEQDFLWGTNILHLDLRDETSLVRYDRENVMTGSLTWRVIRGEGQPTLFIRPAQAGPVLSWAVDSPGFTLERSAFDQPVLWTPFLTISNQTELNLSPADTGLFRLRRN
jgi:hypothetical protein